MALVTKSTESTNKLGSLDRNLKLSIELDAKNTYEVHWINRHDQFGCTTMEAIIKTNGFTTRIPRKWRVAPELIDADFLEAEAKVLLVRVDQEKVAAEGSK